MKPLTQTAELEVLYSVTPDWETLPVISSSTRGYEVLYPYFPTSTIALQEYFIVAYLNRGNRLLGVYQMSRGGITGTIADPRLILGAALKIAASGIILSHNHPSGTLKPSSADIELTTRLRDGAKLMDLSVLDHLIVTPTAGEYCSFADEGLL